MYLQLHQAKTRLGICLYTSCGSDLFQSLKRQILSEDDETPLAVVDVAYLDQIGYLELLWKFCIEVLGVLF